MSASPHWSASLFLNTNYSDLTIRCEGRDFPAHKAIVCTQSSFFTNAVKKGFKEAKEGMINLEEDSITTVEAMLRFLYCGDYDDCPCDDVQGCQSFLLHAQLYVLADKYEIEGLEELTLAKLEHCPCSDVSLLHAASHIYINTPGPSYTARDVLVARTTKCVSSLTTAKRGRSGLFRSALADVPEFAADVALSLGCEFQKYRAFKCKSCNRVWVGLPDSDDTHAICPQQECGTYNSAAHAAERAKDIVVKIG